MRTVMKIYLAGKMDERKSQLIAEFKHLCEFCSFDDSCWKDGFIVGPECWDQCNDAKPFFEAAVLGQIRRCDALIAYLLSNDSCEAISEIAFASTIGKSCYMIVEEHQTDEDKLWGHCPLYDSYWFVGTFPNVQVHHASNQQEAGDCLIGILERLGILPNSYVYFVEALGRNEIKIGSSQNPDQRLCGLQTGNGSELKLLGAMRGDKELERQIQARFKHLRTPSDGEWFYGLNELRESIATWCKA
jgi:hypothetical protein